MRHTHLRAPGAARTGAALLAVLVASCSAPRMQTVQAYAGPPLSPPAHVVVYDFTVSADQVKLDQAVGARVQRAASGVPLGVAEQEAAQGTQGALADELSRRLLSFGLPVERLPAGTTLPPNTILVQGQIDAINQGNRARRVVVGFGAGKSSISADAQLYEVIDPAAPRFLQAFHGSSDSGHMPGAAGTMGAGAVAGRVETSAAMSGAMHAGSEMRRGGDANATRLADALAKQIGAFAVVQGWIAPTAVQ